jgi:hypothetical protein
MINDKNVQDQYFEIDFVHFFYYVLDFLNQFVFHMLKKSVKLKIYKWSIHSLFKEKFTNIQIV